MAHLFLHVYPCWLSAAEPLNAIKKKSNELFLSHLRPLSLKLVIYFLSHWYFFHDAWRVIIYFAMLFILDWKQIILCILILCLASILLITAPETCPSSILFAFFKVTSIMTEFFGDILRAIFFKSALESLCFSTSLFSSSHLLVDPDNFFFFYLYWAAFSIYYTGCFN